MVTSLYAFISQAGLCALLAACQEPIQPGVSHQEAVDAGQEERLSIDAARDFRIPDLPRFSDVPQFLDVIATPYDQAHPAEENGWYAPEQPETDAATGVDALVEYDSSSSSQPFPPEAYVPPTPDAGSDIEENSEQQDTYFPPEGDGSTSDSLPPEICAAYDLPGNFADEDCDGLLICPVPCLENETTRREDCGNGIGGWRTQGMYVSCVAQYANELYASAIITAEERAIMVREAAWSDIGKRLEE
ncbi:MAG: hypothetical protein Q8R53_03230 [Nanoarchaeota archaeon]|nr:hypothetical protein [Nanoarchaeota archaeon]